MTYLFVFFFYRFGKRGYETDYFTSGGADKGKIIQYFTPQKNQKLILCPFCIKMLKFYSARQEITIDFKFRVSILCVPPFLPHSPFLPRYVYEPKDQNHSNLM